MEDANCFGSTAWAGALADAASLFDGCSDCGGTDNDCGLSDGSALGEWRLPNIRELRSLIHYGVHDPALPDTSGVGQWSEGDPFWGVSMSPYWSSTSFSNSVTSAWGLHMSNGIDFANAVGNFAFVWAVRGGQ